MTEEEAKTKWCPMVRADNTSDLHNAQEGTPPFVKTYNAVCIGSACMMWRWIPPQVGIDENSDELLGYCGLAGKP